MIQDYPAGYFTSVVLIFNAVIAASFIIPVKCFLAVQTRPTTHLNERNV